MSLLPDRHIHCALGSVIEPAVLCSTPLILLFVLRRAPSVAKTAEYTRSWGCLRKYLAEDAIDPASTCLHLTTTLCAPDRRLGGQRRFALPRLTPPVAFKISKP